MKRLSALALVSSLVVGAPACTTEVIIGGAKADQVIGEPPATHTGTIDKVDLLFVVDNSASMANKQDALARRIPVLLRLLTQIGIDPIAAGASKIVDLHVAVITSSLGSQGTSACDPAQSGPRVDDRARLLPPAGEFLPLQGYTFAAGSADPRVVACPIPMLEVPVSWVLDGARDPSAELHGADALPTLEAAVTCSVLSAGDEGCGYEMPLEAMYRFLADPSPALTRAAACGASSEECGSSTIEHRGVDTTLLVQRAAFLRPDSLLAIVLLTDESDSSLRAEGTNWLPWSLPKGRMPRGLPACASVPDDVEPTSDAEAQALHWTAGCWSCAEAEAPKDSACVEPWAITSSSGDVDGMNLRAFHQLQRFGRDFLYPTSRYVDALTRGSVIDDDGYPRPNPVFAGGRARDMVVVAGIVGVPPAIVVDAAGFPKHLNESDWEKLVSPDPTRRDPHMLESIAPRAGIAHFAGDSGIDLVNGGDRDVLGGDDLQYACLGPIVATGSERNVECVAGAEARNPACLGLGGQRLRAYPAIRPLRVIHGVGNAGYVASICDANYRGAVAGIATKIGQAAR